MIGKTISHYTIIEKIGEGGMGVVYKAKDTQLERIVALKFLAPHAVGSGDDAARFIREARAAASLNHSNICTIYEIAEHEGRPFIAMEYIEGKSLRDTIAAGPVTVDDAVRFALQAAEGLVAAHAAGVVHRDIKSANIMIANDGKVTIMDFGLAKSTGSSQITRDGTTLGTTAYMSPEQARGEAVDHRSDIWSLGVVLYEMITGRQPFRGEHEQAVIYSILNTEPEPVTARRSGVPAALERVVTRCLQKDPSKRFQTAGELAAALQTAPGDASHAWHARVERARERQRRERRWFQTPMSRGLWLLLISLPAIAFLIIRVVVPHFFSAEVQRPVSRLTMIAVLPFQNLGPPEEEYFADGITDAITARLTGIHGLGVISRQSAIQYKGSEKSVQTIGEELGVDYILEGTIQRERPGDPTSRVRIIPQLIEVSDDIHLWADTYDEDMTEMFSIQSDIAERVARALDVTLFENERQAIQAVPTTNLEAYEYYLRGNEYFSKRYSSNNMKAVEMYVRATELDPAFTAAWAKLSRSYIWASYTYTSDNPRLKEQAKAAVDRAAALDPDSPDVLMALAYYYYYGGHEFRRALEYLERARKERPNDIEILNTTAFIKRRLGEWEESRTLLELSSDLDPRYGPSVVELGITCVTLRQYDEAERVLDRAIFLTPHEQNPRIFKILLYLLRDGDIERARKELRESTRYVPPAQLGFDQAGFSLTRILCDTYAELLDAVQPAEYGIEDTTMFDIGLAEMYHQLGEEKEARACWERSCFHIEATTHNPVHQYSVSMCLALVYAGLGRHDEAVRLAREVLEDAPLSVDALMGTMRMETAAVVFVRCGAYEEAIDQLETLLSVPSDVSSALVRIDPAYEPLRDNPRFQKLVHQDSY